MTPSNLLTRKSDVCRKQTTLFNAKLDHLVLIRNVHQQSYRSMLYKCVPTSRNTCI
uniref:Uncharacterized protein n=1 Tax=Arundo donax TaxID=35708 RepID=A0A0A9AWC8_ARUDO